MIVNRISHVDIAEVEWLRFGGTRHDTAEDLEWREREGNDPSEDAACAPPNRFEDGEAHLDPSAPAAEYGL